MISVFRSAAEKRLSVQQLIDGRKMLVLVLVLVVVLQVEGTRGGNIHLYRSSAESAVLPSERPSSSYRCSDVNWFYNRNTSETQSVVENGKVVDRSPRASRLNLSSNCSLIISYITADDAGRYTYRSGSGFSVDGNVYLSVLTFSDVDLTEEDLTLPCSLWKHSDLGPCPEKSFRWLGNKRTVLTCKSDDRSSRQRCFSTLTVEHQIDNNRVFICQFVEGNSVKVESVFVLGFLKVHIGVERGEPVNLYHRVGDEAVLPCNRPSSFDSCSSVKWIYERNKNMNDRQEVHRGIVQSSPRSARMSLDRICSLTINNITEEDVGRYNCQFWDRVRYETDVFLNLLIIISSPPRVHATLHESVRLICSLLRYRSSDPCPVKSLRWVDETGSELTDEGDGYKSVGQFGCDSHLIVSLQSSRRFTCQFVEGNEVKIEAHYQHEAPGNTNTSIIIIIIILGSVIGVLLLVVVLAAVFIKLRKTRNKEDRKTTTANQDSTNENHQYLQPDEETAMRTKEKTEADIDPSDVDSCLTEPK
ncbi:uncharacterized protein LOC103457191 isoform X2 [Poecilia reticulata]|uniref:uncharacterized protein LOC103457191 isoform X2 n=1 Tax=Poecilia reticulata TaxID=8081 RepID=UPI0004A45CA8|nr:PREDICTED: uncharacterized protein LOC103457191 isoform X2 [Poecilia reticulata]